MIKRFVSLLIIMTLLISAIPCSAQTDKNAENEYYAFLKGIGVLDFEYEGIETFTRNLLAYLLAGLTDCNTGSEADIGIFKDVDSKCRFNIEIAHAYKMGYMLADKNGYFYPDNRVTFDDVAFAFTTALGYTDVCESRGGYPNGYRAVAEQIGIGDGIKARGKYALSADEVYRAAYNFLHAEVGTYSGYINDGNGYDTYRKLNIEGTTAMKEYLGIDFKEGVLNTAGLMSISEKNMAEKNSIWVDGMRFICNTDSYEALLGYSVKCYYKESDTSRNNQALYVAADGNRELMLEDGMIDKVSINPEKTVISYYQNNKTHSISVPQSADLVYNGRPLPLYEEADIKKENTTLKLIDNNEDGRYDVMIVTSYAMTFVDSVNADIGFIGDINSVNNLTVPEDDEPDRDYKIFFGGNRIDISGLLKYDVLSVAESKDKTVARIYCSRDKVEGKITSTTSKDGHAELQIGTGVYEVNNLYTKFPLTLGTEGVFYLDIFGRISGADAVSGDYKYAYLIDIGIIYTGFEDNTVKFKLLTEDGELIVLEGRKKIVFNNVSTKKEELEASPLLFENGNAIPQLVRYAVSSAGELSRLNTADSVSEEGFLKKDYSSSKAYYTTYNYSFDGETYLDEDTRVFFVPEDSSSTDDSLFYMGSMYSFVAFDEYDIVAYDYDDFNVAKAIVAKKTLAINESDSYFLVTNKGVRIDEEGNAVNFISGVTNKMIVKFSVADNVATDSLQKGDIIRISLNNRNEIAFVQKCYTGYDIDNIKDIFGITWGTSQATNLKIESIVGKVVKSSGGRIVVDSSKVDGVNEYTVHNLCYGSLNVYKYFCDRNIAELSAKEEICAEDVVIMRMHAGRVYDVIILR